MLPTLPPIEQSSLGVAVHGEEASAPSILEMTDVILLAEGAMVAGLAEKSTVKPSPVRIGEGSRTHFFQFTMKPAFMEVSMITSREDLARPFEGLAPRPSST